MGPALDQKLFEGPATGCHKERLSRVGIVKGNLTLLAAFSRILDKGCLFKITAVLGVVTIEIADTIGRVLVTSPSQIVLNGPNERRIKTPKKRAFTDT